ncbi:hypothetical protein [Facklamia sp. 7083-14-GEN3]|nr:hypothetical protein [Facklamia sp. 7083-14-GEN3]MCR8969568.1 hypothetical protein [Facklamia sp. 7083-14-GEN3]
MEVSPHSANEPTILLKLGGSFIALSGHFKDANKVVPRRLTVLRP